MRLRRAETGPSCLFSVALVARHGENKLVILRKRIAGLSASTLERFVLQARRAVPLPGTVDVLVTSSAEVQSLSRKFRGINKATDVLSFPSSPLAGGRAKRSAGEVAISADIARANAGGLGHSVAEEVKILALHGILHLAGFDHERDNGEMARKEKRLRRQLKLELALIERSQPRRHASKSNPKSERGRA